MSSSLAILLLLLLVAAFAGAAHLVRKMPSWRRPGRTRRIKVLGKDKIIISVAGTRNCPACRKPLTEGDLTARCSVNPAHEIHKACKVLVNGKCPKCGHALE